MSAVLKRENAAGERAQPAKARIASSHSAFLS